MSDHRDRDAKNKEIVDTTKALIELYKSAFGDNWENVFSQTVRVNVLAA
ncbi:MAG: hypothetical protein WBV55_11100 [Candidatus Sulfotelmatobacter sp.]